MIIPHMNISQDNFQFFNKGRELWLVESEMKENIEDKLRYQLEAANLP